MYTYKNNVYVLMVAAVLATINFNCFFVLWLSSDSRIIKRSLILNSSTGCWINQDLLFSKNSASCQLGSYVCQRKLKFWCNNIYFVTCSTDQQPEISGAEMTGVLRQCDHTFSGSELQM